MEEHLHVRGEVPWKTSLWGLPFSHACPLSILCPCGVYYKTAELLSGAAQKPSCCKSLLLGCCCYGGLSLRGDLRDKYNLKGGECSDFWVHCCCQCLALGQVYRETRAWANDPTACCPKALAAAAAKATQNRAVRESKQGRPLDLDSSREENDRRPKVKVGPTPTERYDQLLTELGVVDNTNLGKKASKTLSTAPPPKNHGSAASEMEVNADRPTTVLLDDSDILSEKEYELHKNFLGVTVDSGKLIQDPRAPQTSVPGSDASQHTSSQSSCGTMIKHQDGSDSQIQQDRHAYYASRISESIPDVPDAALAKALGDGHLEF